MQNVSDATHLQMAPKFDTLFCMPYNTIFKLFDCQNQEIICNNTMTEDPTTPQMCHYTTLWNVSVLKATIKNMTIATTNVLEINNRKQRVHCLSYCVKWLLQPVVFTSNVHCVRLSVDDAFLKCVVTEVVLFSVVAFKTLTFHKVV